MKRLKNNSDVPEVRHGTFAQKHFQARKRQGCVLLARGRMGTPGCVNKKRAEGQRVRS